MVSRVILIGASNLTIAFPLVVETLRLSLDGLEQIFAAHGHGRSYGTWSRVLFRGLPGIKDCHLWEALSHSHLENSKTLALLTDIGNDILYGVEPDQIAEWVELCLQRLQAQKADVVLTRLPLCSLRRLSVWRYNLTRACFFPRSRMTYSDMIRRAESLNCAVQRLGQHYGVTLMAPDPAWYGFDPIHIRRSRRAQAWQQILSSWSASDTRFEVRRSSWRSAVRFWRTPPAERTICGHLSCRPQPAQRWDDGTTLSLY